MGVQKVYKLENRPGPTLLFRSNLIQGGIKLTLLIETFKFIPLVVKLMSSMSFSHAYVLVNVEIGAESRIVNELKKVPEITEAWVVYGVYDIVVKVKAENPEKLKEIVSERIRKIDGVRNTLTLIPVEGFP